jgi:hypothetical protein
MGGARATSANRLGLNNINHRLFVVFVCVILPVRNKKNFRRAFSEEHYMDKKHMGSFIEVGLSRGYSYTQ